MSAGTVSLTNITVQMPEQKGTNGRVLYIGEGGAVELLDGAVLANGYLGYGGGGVLVDHSIDACRRVGVGLHISIQIFGGGGDIPLPQRLVIQKDQRLKIHGQEVLLAADLAGFYCHRQGVCQNIRARYLRQGSQNVHGHEGAQGVMGVEIHVRAVCRVTSVQLQLVGKAGLFLKRHRDVVAGKSASSQCRQWSA